MLNNREKLQEVVERIMTEMFFLFPDIDENGEQVTRGKPTDDSIKVSVHFSSHDGLLFKADHELLAKMASNFMGILPDRIEEEHLRSMAAEAANIIGGNYLSEVDPDSEYDLAVPKIIETDVDISIADWHINYISGGGVLIIVPADSEDIGK